MNRVDARQSAMEELARVDYFLDQLARAVERGEVPMESYTVLAPRYLAQREQLVATISGTPSGTESQRAREHGATSGAPSTYRAAESTAVPAAARRPAKPRREHAPVHWTTVLLFLGAFLVIVASGIFAAVVWDLTGPAFKLAFLTALTVAFYAAGYTARAKFKLRAGGLALTVVASAMLVFDCWIVIDGYSLTGPYPWAIAMLLCSSVYWLTEVTMGERFYGVVGAVAQIAWWWLLGAGLGVEAPVRIAGIGVVAAIWQLTAERVAKESAAATLAAVLEWAAPLVESAVLVAMLGHLIAIRTPETAAIISSVVVAGCAAFVAMRTRHLPRGRLVVAAVAQIPFLLAVAGASQVVQWWMVGALAAATAVYAAASLAGGGTPFAILALVAEFSTVGLVGELLPSMSDAVAIVVYAALAVSWVASARMAQRISEDSADTRFSGAGAFSRCAWIGGFALLVLSSVMALSYVGEVPMNSAAITGTGVALSAAILAAWAGASLLRRQPPLAIGATLWSYFSLATAVAWLLPRADVAWHYLPLIVLAAVWLAIRGAMSRFYGVDADVFAWMTRAVAGLLVLAGIVSAVFRHGGLGTWPSMALGLAGALVFIGDALLNSQTASAAVAGLFATVAALLSGGAVALATTGGLADVSRLGSRQWGYEAMAAAAGALVFSAGAFALKSRYREQASAFALAAAGAGLVACEAAVGDARYAAVSLALVACAWALAAFVTEWHWLTALGGVLLLGSVACVMSRINGSGWVTVAVFVVLTGALNGVGAAPVFSRHRRLAAVGWSLAGAGLLGLLVLAVFGNAWSAIAGSVPAQLRWLAIGWHGDAVVLAFLGAMVIIQSQRYHFEPALYVGYGVLMLAAMSEFQGLRLTTAEVYSTTVAVYTAGMGYLYAAREPARRVPLAIDIVATLMLLWLPVASSLTALAGPDLFVHMAWTVGLSLAAIVAGITLRVRAYLYGGAAAIALVALWRTAAYLVQFWWVVLGIIGIAMLVVALTWERQRMLLSDTQRRVRDGFENWR